MAIRLVRRGTPFAPPAARSNCRVRPCVRVRAGGGNGVETEATPLALPTTKQLLRNSIRTIAITLPDRLQLPLSFQSHPAYVRLAEQFEFEVGLLGYTPGPAMLYSQYWLLTGGGSAAASNQPAGAFGTSSEPPSTAAPPGSGSGGSSSVQLASTSPGGFAVACNQAASTMSCLVRAQDTCDEYTSTSSCPATDSQAPTLTSKTVWSRESNETLTFRGSLSLQLCRMDAGRGLGRQLYVRVENATATLSEVASTKQIFYIVSQLAVKVNITGGKGFQMLQLDPEQPTVGQVAVTSRNARLQQPTFMQAFLRGSSVTIEGKGISPPTVKADLQSQSKEEVTNERIVLDEMYGVKRDSVNVQRWIPSAWRAGCWDEYSQINLCHAAATGPVFFVGSPDDLRNVEVTCSMRMSFDQLQDINTAKLWLHYDRLKRLHIPLGAWTLAVKE